MARWYLMYNNQIYKVKSILLQIHKALCRESHPFEKQNRFSSLCPAGPLPSYEESLGSTSLITCSVWSQQLKNRHKIKIISSKMTENGSASNIRLCGCNMLMSTLLNNVELSIKSILCIMTVSSKLRVNWALSISGNFVRNHSSVILEFHDYVR